MAFDWIYRRCEPAVRRTAGRLAERAGYPTVAGDDVAQDVWTKVWRALSGDGLVPWDGREPDAWVAKILQTTFVSACRTAVARKTVHANPRLGRGAEGNVIVSYDLAKARYAKYGDTDTVELHATPFPWDTWGSDAPTGEWLEQSEGLGQDPAEVVAGRDEAAERGAYARRLLAGLSPNYRSWVVRALTARPDHFIVSTKRGRPHRWSFSMGYASATDRRAYEREKFRRWRAGLALERAARQHPVPVHLHATKWVQAQYAA